MDFIKGVFSFYVNSVLIALILGLLIGNYFGVASEFGTWGKVPGSLISAVIDGNVTASHYFYGNDGTK